LSSSAIDHIHGLNLILVNKVKNIYIHYTDICYFYKICSHRKREISHNDSSIGSGAKLAYQAAPKTLGKKYYFCFLTRLVQSHLKDTKWFPQHF
jgi:hypothetical protein